MIGDSDYSSSLPLNAVEGRAATKLTDLGTAATKLTDLGTKICYRRVLGGSIYSPMCTLPSRDYSVTALQRLTRAPYGRGPTKSRNGETRNGKREIGNEKSETGTSHSD